MLVGCGNFGARAEAAELRVEVSRRAFARALSSGCERQRRVAGRGGRRHLGERLLQRFALLRDVRRDACGRTRHPPQQVGERRHAVARLLREVRAAEERPLIVPGARNIVSGQPPPRCVSI